MRLRARQPAPVEAREATAAERIAEHIVRSQVRVVGDAAWQLARRVKGLDVAEDRPPRIDGDPAIVIEKLVREYTSITGELGARMCFMAVADLLRDQPDLDIESFRGFRRFA